MLIVALKRWLLALVFALAAGVVFLNLKTVASLVDFSRTDAGHARVTSVSRVAEEAAPPTLNTAADARRGLKPAASRERDPLTAPVCHGVVASITTESSDAVWSAAALRVAGESRGRLRRVGDDVAGKTVSYIGFNGRAGSPAVWLSSGSELCQVLLFYPEPLLVSEGAHVAISASTVPREIESRIQRLSNSKFRIDRRAVDAILADQSALMNGVRVTPERRDGKTVGLRLINIRENSLLHEIGLKSGDRIESINGFDIADPERALEAYARLRLAPKLELVLNRRGAPLEIEYLIE
jgi:general secretion pathway protein C